MKIKKLNLLKTLIICLFLGSSEIDAAYFQKFSVSCVTEKSLETGRSYGFTDEYIMREWLKSSPYMFDGEFVWFKGMVSGWIKIKMKQSNNNISWQRYSNSLEVNTYSSLDTKNLVMKTRYGNNSDIQKSHCIKNTWNEGLELSKQVRVK
jgi:hypothetical protein